MGRLLIAVTCCCLVPVSPCQQRRLASKDIYNINCKAIVQIRAGNEFGVGFIVSADGRIMTANHVITTTESGFRQYSPQIEVSIPGNQTPYTAVPLNEAPSSDQVNFDSAIIKITGSGFPHVTVGDGNSADVADTVTILSTYPGFGCMLLQGIVSAKGATTTPLGPKPVDTLIFQAPIRNGFSGSPIFDSRGKVIGIEDTKVFGISQALGQLRDEWEASRQHGYVRFSGIDIAGSFLETINNLDQNLISGLGSGVNVRYAKALEESDSR